MVVIVTFTNEQVAAGYKARLRRQGIMRPDWVYFMKLAGEAAEANEEFLRECGWSRHAATPGHLAEELADVVISAYTAAQSAGVDLDAAIQAKHAVLMRRDEHAGCAHEPEGRDEHAGCAHEPEGRDEHAGCGHEPEGREIAYSDPELI